MTAPQLEPTSAVSEAGRGWLLWLAGLGALLFSLMLYTREVPLAAGGSGLLLCGALIGYESRRLKQAWRWKASFAQGFLGGLGLGSAGALVVNATGWLRVLDQQNKLTAEGMVLFWGLFLIGMGLAARHAARPQA